MSSPRSPESLPAANALLLVAAAAAILLAASVALSPRAGALGGLAAFVFWSSAPLGAVLLALIHETTGGRWGAASTPILRLGCAGALFLPIFFVVLLPGVRLIYPWARGDVPEPDVGRVLLNAPAFAACGLVALVVWAIIGLLLAGDRVNLLGAALALVFHGVAVSVIAVVWMLSLDPGFTNSAFGAQLAVQEIMLALALIAALTPERAIALAKGDIGALLFATSLGAFYLALMTFVVKWYGDQPEDAGWYLARAHGLPFALLVGALVFGAVIPIIGCAWERVRLNARPLRAVGLSAIFGVFLQDLWLAGADSLWVIASALFGIAGMASLSLWFGSRLEQRLGVTRAAEAGTAR
ncbi:MAG TPA: hypothetical protein VIZ19_00350 [Roseiarcus sp.]